MSCFFEGRQQPHGVLATSIDTTSDCRSDVQVEEMLILCIEDYLSQTRYTIGTTETIRGDNCSRLRTQGPMAQTELRPCWACLACYVVLFRTFQE